MWVIISSLVIAICWSIGPPTIRCCTAWLLIAVVVVVAASLWSIAPTAYTYKWMHTQWSSQAILAMRLFLIWYKDTHCRLQLMTMSWHAHYGLDVIREESCYKLSTPPTESWEPTVWQQVHNIGRSDDHVMRLTCYDRWSACLCPMRTWHIQEIWDVWWHIRVTYHQL